MIRIVAIVAAIFFFVTLLRVYVRLDPAGRKKFWGWLIFGLLFAGVIALTVTGRLHFIAAIVAGILPFAKKLVPFLRYIPLLRRLYNSQKQSTQSQQGAQQPVSAALSLEEAYQVLGLEAGATREEVIEAHRKLMQKLHPDRGGNDYLAARLNQAKDMLLEHLGKR